MPPSACFPFIKLGFLFLLCCTSVFAQVSPGERAALIALYENTGGVGWVRQTKPNSSIRWKDPAGTECSWFGVTCDAGNQRVISLDLQANNLIGNLPPLDGLANLVSIDVSTNRLSGRLPALTALQSLRTFFAYNNRFSGPLPALAGLANLTSFSVSTNLLTGAIPEIASLKALDRFDVSKNQLSGVLPSLAGLSALTDFNASENKIIGTIPELNSLSSLRYFSISDNQLGGTIPSIDNLRNLIRFNVANNQLSGQLPQLSNLRGITFFYANNNSFVGPVPDLTGLLLLSEFDISTNQLTGNLPSLNENVQLKIFNASFNRIQGPIPSLDTLKILEVIDLSNNALSGSIPSFRALERIVVIKLNNNQLTQFIPQINFLETLVTFHVHSNLLTGNLPSLYADNRCSATGEGYFAGLPRLTQFNASANQLSGSIPQLTWQRWPVGCGLLLYDNSLISLEEFNVSNNRLTGAVPVIATLRRLSTFLVFDNRLTGSIPTLTSLPSLKTVDFSKNQLTGSLPEFTAVPSLLGFYASDNQLTGSIPSLGLLSSLVGFDVSNNRLSGSIPPINTLGDLRSFIVESNQLTGTLPNLSGLQSLTFFRASKNMLTGSIPSFPLLPNLIEFALAFNNLSGPLPSLDNLKSIRSVVVNDNKLSGLVPAAPPALTANGSALCPNFFAKTSDLEWDRATGQEPWFSTCLDDPTAPSISGISPNSGSTKGGIQVLINGVNFTNVTGVLFGSTAASGYNVVNSSQITAIVPPGQAGAVRLVVLTQRGAAVSPVLFTYLSAALEITRMVPVSGPGSGGTVVTIVGSGFSEVKSVEFGTQVASFKIESDSQISALSPASPAGTVPVRVITSTSQAIAPQSYTFTDNATGPQIKSFSPISGPPGGGTSVDILGERLSGTSIVQFGTRIASYRIISDSRIVAIAPASNAGPVSIRITTQNGSVSSTEMFTYRDPALQPRIARVSPASGSTSGGTVVSIVGSRLDNATSVTFGGRSARFIIISDQQIDAISPPAPAGSVPISVVTSQGEAVYQSFVFVSLAASTADRVFGQNNSFSSNSASPPSATTLVRPSGVVVDYYGKLYVADTGNNRVTVYPPGSTTMQQSITQSATVLLGRLTGSPMRTPSAIGLANEYLYVAEGEPGRVAQFAAPVRDGGAPETVWSNLKFLDSAPSPEKTGWNGGVATDRQGNIYISSADGVNYWPRTCCFPPIRTYPATSLPTDSTLKNPGGVAVDQNGGIYVADTGNNRVLYFPPASLKANRVYGQPDFTSASVRPASSVSLNRPMSVAIDSGDGIYVADSGNNRVLHFSSGSTIADAVYGQGGSFTSSSSAGVVNSSTFRTPTAVAVGGSGLYVADTGNNRVLHFPFQSYQPVELPEISGVAHSASFRAGGVAPGEIVTVFGKSFGPDALVGLGIESNGLVSTSLGGTRLLFDGIAAPMIYAVKGQLSAIVPYSVSGKASTRIQVEDKQSGAVSAPLTIPVVPASPGLYTSNSSGNGQVAMFNEDYSLNGSASPAARGSVVVFYGTGEGQTIPNGVDGKINDISFPAPVLPVKVSIGTKDAKVLYFGAAPGFVAGVFQVNAVVPLDAPAGAAVPIQVMVGEASSPVGTTLAVK